MQASNKAKPNLAPQAKACGAFFRKCAETHSADKTADGRLIYAERLAIRRLFARRMHAAAKINLTKPPVVFHYICLTLF